MRKIPTNEHWAVAQVDGIPARWQRRLLSNWDGVRKQYERTKLGADSAAQRLANIGLREIVERLSKVRLPLDADDSQITERAEEFAAQAMDAGRLHASHGIEKVRAGMESFCRLCGVKPPPEKMKDRPAVSRMTCRDWWRRGLRKMHAKAVEGAAIELGYVNKARDLYVSQETLTRRMQQIRRNARMMEATRLRNEEGQEFTLAELAAKGVGNKAIRRGELMTRISGFEKIAVESSHVGLFLTATCPSRMHKYAKAKSGKVYENRKFDGTTPREAQQYLSKCWARIRAKLARHGAQVYGFRIAEPHHDGCPHWHLLVFCEPWAKRRILHTFRHYLLADSPDEAGAAKHRFTSLQIDWSKGSAAGYIAKYVAKNIDGLHVGEDLFGNPAMETSQRVEAWASTWGIRQFQQIGGAPVGVWRELRRVQELPEGAPSHLIEAHAAVNKTEGADGETKSADWAAYCRLQGGVFVGRNARIKIEAQETGELGRYGEEVAPRPIGVSTLGAKEYFIGRFKAVGEVVKWVANSIRHAWEVVRSAGRSLAPRTRVNNCTRIGFA